MLVLLIFATLNLEKLRHLCSYTLVLLESTIQPNGPKISQLYYFPNLHLLEHQSDQVVELES